MKNVLYVLNAANGGATLSAKALMAGLGQKGYRCYAVVPPGGSAEALQELRSACTDLIEVPLPWWNKRYRVQWWKRPLHWARAMTYSGFHCVTVTRLARQLDRWKIDLVHTNTALTPDGAFAAQFARRPHVWHIREQIGEGQLHRFWLPDSVMRRLFSGLSSRILVNSCSTGRFFKQTQHGGKVEVVYNGLAVDDFHAPDRGRALRQTWSIEPGQILVGMVASLSARWKRHDLFLRAAAASGHHDQVRFVVIGDDPDREGGTSSTVAYARDLKELAGRLGLDGRLQWAGFVQDIPAVMNALDILVHPCEQEGFGRVALEAMVAGVPVIAAGSGGVAEVVENGVTGLHVASQTPEAYAAAIERLVEDSETRATFGEQGNQRARDRFSLDRTLNRVAAIYHDLLSANVPA